MRKSFWPPLARRSNQGQQVSNAFGPINKKVQPSCTQLESCSFSILNHYTSINPHHLQGYIKSLGRSLALSFSSVRTDLASLAFSAQTLSI